MGKKIKTLFLALIDSLVVIGAILLAWYIIKDSSFHPVTYYYLYCVTLLASYHIFAFIFNLYYRMWIYASVKELLSIVYAVTAAIITSAMLSSLVLSLLKMDNTIEISLLVIAWLFLIVFIGGIRLISRIMNNDNLDDSDFERVLIFGAGRGGTTLARQMVNVPTMKMKPIIFLDDDEDKSKQVINGIKVIGTRQQLKSSIEKYNINKVVIAIPSLTKNKLKELHEICVECGVNVQIMPNIDDVLTGKKEVSHLKNIDLEDLLGRDPVKLDSEGIRDLLNNKTILITGAGGSIGSEIVRQVSAFGPEKVLLLGHGENSIYMIQMEMRNKFKDGHTIFVPIIADIQDRERIFNIMEEYKPDVVYHAAAHKHVPLMEANPSEAIKNNIFGTKNVAEAAAAAGVKSFVMISTDKAVNPPNIMGATKRWAEMVIQNLDKVSATKFVAVRFGNVLGSRGSVIPLFKRQIEKGGPVTVTHPDITRYFMTIPEASRLVIQAGALAKGGEVFVLDMGEPVKIADLAKNVIELAGYSVDEIGIEFSGLRPGEKMYEELLNENEVSREQVHEKIFVGKAVPKDFELLKADIALLPSLSDEEIKKLVIGEANKKF
ncbi:nucleoside-diphosphate sugar epimerase/dehydratase [Macrococcus sp. DPC7161]|uniref:nucleoside-diphosphate sugar epimerase/dehydratase n=1 Tax=Macrococcus sp. DPC7161 TaxID=2507060 RepID=UPI00100B452E|nr:nucleoside-diphosphate sugar epimerase/dehydratase [Macrococcus sp. DPC7161]RXK18815.1 polysaccharide biosynthesis protein [Macrococcus sp. DPC7161]